MKFIENIWKYKGNATKMQCGGIIRNSLKLEGGTLVEINENLWNSMKTYENTKKIQRKCNVAASPTFNEIAREYPCRKQWKSMKIQWNSMKNIWKYKENTTDMQCGAFAEIQWNCKGVPL